MMEQLTARQIIERLRGGSNPGKKKKNDKDPYVPVGAWPYVLTKIGHDEERGVMFEFLKILSSSVDLFKDAERRM